ncbi:Transcription factor WhiB, partial [Streptomyces sp. SolWspMP-sol7th]
MADFSRLPGPNADLWDWQLLAACRGVDSSLFFHPEGERGAARSAREASAKEVCMRCPVRAECAAHALAVREPYGVWGGRHRGRAGGADGEGEASARTDWILGGGGGGGAVGRGESVSAVP